jgi:hypothetical protein
MWTLIRNGGVIPMSFLMLFGAAALLAAFFFAVRGERKTLGFVKGMAAATLFTTLAATCAEVEAAGEPYTFRGHPINPHAMIIEGLAESTSPGIVGFSFLALTSMLTAVGRRRMDERRAA